MMAVCAVFSSCWTVCAEDDFKLEEPSNWSQFFDLRTEAGYRDNPTYTATSPTGSMFTAIKLEYTLVRLPVDDWQVLVLSSADATSFIDNALTDHEVFTFSLFQVQKETLPGRNWEAGFQHVYQDQQVDASTTVANQGSVAIHGHTLQGYARWKQQWTTGWWLAAKPMLEWQTVEMPLDDSYEPGLEFSLGREWQRHSSITLSYEFHERVFDRLTPTDAFGAARGEGSLHFRQHQVQLVYRRDLDQDGHWRATARGDWLRNLDNGEGFFDYNRGRMALELRWRQKPWEIKLSSRASSYDYSIQRIAGAGSAMREKLLTATGLQVRREFKHGWYVIARGEIEHSLSNQAADRYSASLVSLGLGWGN